MQHVGIYVVSTQDFVDYYPVVELVKCYVDIAFGYLFKAVV